MRRWQHRRVAHGERSTFVLWCARPAQALGAASDARPPILSAPSMRVSLSRWREHPITPAVGLSSIVVLGACGFPTSPWSVSGAVFYGALTLMSLAATIGLIESAWWKGPTVLDRPPTQVKSGRGSSVAHLGGSERDFTPLAPVLDLQPAFATTMRRVL